MSTLHEYLMSDQAREDVRELLDGDKPSLPVMSMEDLCLVRDEVGAWRSVMIWDDNENRELTAYYRPDGDRFVVTDLGEGVRALRLRTGCSQHLAMERSDPMREALRTSGIGNVWSTERGIMELDNITATDLPDAICRVMLASLRVAEVTP